MIEDIGTHIVDTVYAPDIRRWETAVEIKDGREKIFPVQTYGTEQEAEEGQARWVKRLKENPSLNVEGLQMKTWENE